MADKKSGYEKAAEVQEKIPRPVEVATSAGAAHDIVTGERTPKSKKPPRKIPADFRAMAEIDDILRNFPIAARKRIMRHCLEKLEEEAGPVASCQTNCERDPRRAPGGDLYTPPFPQLADAHTSQNYNQSENRLDNG